MAVHSNDPGEATPLLEQAILAIANACDGAESRDGIGFSNRDIGFFEPHIATIKEGKRLPPGTRKKILEKLAKYGGQAFQAGVNLNDVADQERELREETKRESGDDERELTQAEQLIDLTDSWDFFMFERQPYVSFLAPLEDGTFRKETHRCSRGGVRTVLFYLYYREYGRAPSNEAVGQAVETIKGKAQFEGKEERVWIRVATHEGRLFLDLANNRGEAVEVSEAGWRITQDPPVRFLRPGGMLPLATPVLGGSLTELRPFLNVDERSWVLAMSWLLFSLIPLHPHPILLMEGPAGSCKSTLARILRSIVDPHSSPIRAQPKDQESIAVMAANNWLCCIDNLPTLPEWLSDALCGLATGSSFGGRKLYSDDEENLISYIRPIILNGIGGLHGKADLGDRIVKIKLHRPPLYRTEGEIFKAVAEVAPRVLGALLTAASVGLRKKGVSL